MGKKRRTKTFPDEEECAGCGKEFDIDELEHLPENSGGLCRECMRAKTCRMPNCKRMLHVGTGGTTCEECSRIVDWTASAARERPGQPGGQPQPPAQPQCDVEAKGPGTAAAAHRRTAEEWGLIADAFVAAEAARLEEELAQVEREQREYDHQLTVGRKYLLQVHEAKRLRDGDVYEGTCRWCKRDTAAHRYCGLTGARHIHTAEAFTRVKRTDAAYPIDPDTLRAYPVLNDVRHIVAFGDVLSVPAAAILDAKAWLTVFLEYNAGAHPPQPLHPTFVDYCSRERLI